MYGTHNSILVPVKEIHLAVLSAGDDSPLSTMTEEKIAVLSTSDNP